MSVMIYSRTEALTFATEHARFVYLVVGREWGADDDSAALIAADDENEALEAHADLLDVELAEDDPGPGQYLNTDSRLVGAVYTSDASTPAVPVVGSVS